MRHYSFTNFYLSSIQQGIQGAHGLMELFIKYPELHPNDPKGRDYLYTWAQKHKTMICLNGGMEKDLQDLHDFFLDERNPYPFSVFRESKEALNGTLTNVSIILTEEIYETADLFRKSKCNPKEAFFAEAGLVYHFTEFQKELIMKISEYSLAR